MKQCHQTVSSCCFEPCPSLYHYFTFLLCCFAAPSWSSSLYSIVHVGSNSRLCLLWQRNPSSFYVQHTSISAAWFTLPLLLSCVRLHSASVKSTLGQNMLHILLRHLFINVQPHLILSLVVTVFHMFCNSNDQWQQKVFYLLRREQSHKVLRKKEVWSDTIILCSSPNQVQRGAE